MEVISRNQNSILETERLRLRPFTLEDTKFIVELLNSPGWLEFIGDRNVKTEKQAADYLRNGPLKSYAENGYGLSLVETKDGQPVGMCGIIKRDLLEHPDIGFAFLEAFTGKGFAFEIAKATLSHAIAAWNISKVSAITLPHNKRSIQLLEKIGLVYVKSYTTEKGEELCLFETQ